MPDDRQGPIPLSLALGAPAIALVRAQAEAGRATLEFIEQFGFERSGENDLGRLRVVEFTRETAGPDGKPETIRTALPLLSLVPLPSASIQRADIQYAIRVSGVFQRPADKGAKQASGAQTEIYGEFSPGDPQDAGFLRIHLETAPAELPAGFAKLLQAMDASIHDRREKPSKPTIKRKVDR